jgi:spermidine synthase
MLGVTTFISTEVGSAPLIWVIPLALYLLSFVVAFSRIAPRVHPHLIRALPILLLIMPVLLVVDLGQFPLTVAGFHLATFFVIATVCHGEMARLRPPPGRLTEFYFWMSLGGVLGGSVNALVAPHVFNDVWEYPLFLVLAALLRPRAASESAIQRWHWHQMAWPAALGLSVVAAQWMRVRGIESRVAMTLVAYAIPAGLCYLIQGGSRLRFAVCYALLVFGSASALKSERVVTAERGFFGVNKVVCDRDDGFIMLINGTTMHGLQRTDGARRAEPLSYYHPDGPVGDLFALAHAEGLNRIGVIGLGTGTIASYLQPGQTVDFYEIDPTVSEFAQDPRYFSFLQECRARWQIISGDARVRLRELAAQYGPREPELQPVAWHAGDQRRYQLLVLDAFSSDSIPSHLVTVEAFQLYLSVLQNGGMISANITNKHLDLRPLIQALAETLGLHAVIREDRVVGTLRQNNGRTSCVWVVLTTESNVAEALKNGKGWRDLTTHRTVRVWTDDFCNLLDLITW